MAAKLAEQAHSLEFAADAGVNGTVSSLLQSADAAFSSPGAGTSRTLRRSWLDTFDWRLYRAGLTLEQVTSRGTAKLVLTGRSGDVIAEASARGPDQASTAPASTAQASTAQASTAERARAANGTAPRRGWPRLLGSLPAGPLRDRLRPVVGVRALAPVARAVSRVREHRVLNSDAKTVALLAEDETRVTYPASACLPARLTVTAVRGYGPETARLAGLLAAAPGFSGPAEPVLDSALAAVGRRPADYAGKLTVRLDPAEPAAAGMALIFGQLFDTLEANLPGTVRDVDVEFLHDLRIAVRQTRTGLKLAGQVLPDGARNCFAPEFKWLGDLTTPTRDLDVYLLQYPEMSAGLVAATAAELEPFRQYLVDGRAAAQRALARGLRSARFARLQRDWREALKAAAAADAARPTIGRLAATKITRANRRVLKTGAAITAQSPPDALHDLRKRCKELRYLLEMFGSLHDQEQHSRALKRLKGLQDCLGTFQDAQVQGAQIRRFAEDIMSGHTATAATLLAMGEIAADLARVQRRARDDFEGRFRSFAGSAEQHVLHTLAKAAA
jgi:CHAD domain-containing protein